MTVFPNGTKEPLHGHNYYVGLVIELKSSEFEELIDFSEFKKVIIDTCAFWNEKVLLAIKNPFYKEKLTKKEIEISLCGKRYVFPLEEVVRLEIVNVSSETLSELLLELLVRNLNKKHSDFTKPGKEKRKVLDYVQSMELKLEETRGQGAIAQWKSSPH